MIQVIYSGNKFALKGIFLSIISIVRRTSEDVAFHILTMDYSKHSANCIPIVEDDIKGIESYIKSVNPNHTIRVIDLTKPFVDNFEGGKNVNNRYTPYSLLRLLVDDYNIMPYDEVIYLDFDIMANRDIVELWNEDISNYEYGAALDAIGHYWVNPRYCNSGVLLLNLKKCRETHLLEKVRRRVYKHRYFMPDQTALFQSATARKLLPRKYNEQRDVKPETVLKHFNKYIAWCKFHTVNIKQWDIERVHSILNIYTFDEDYELYLKLTNNNQ